MVTMEKEKYNRKEIICRRKSSISWIYFNVLIGVCHLVSEFDFLEFLLLF